MKHIMLFIFLCTVNTCIAQWSNNPSINTLVCGAAGDQLYSKLVNDGSNGSYITWQDNRFGNNDIYAQKLNQSGQIQWSVYANRITSLSSSQEFPELVLTDGNSIIIVWEDYRSGNSDIYAQLVDLNGNILWGNNGIPVCTLPGNQTKPMALATSNGAIIVWCDQSTVPYKVYGQMLKTTGALLWQINGLELISQAASDRSYSILTDGQDGIVLCWQNVLGASGDIFAQRVDLDGAKLWGSGGTVICNAAGEQNVFGYFNNSGNMEELSGNYIIVWSDTRLTSPDIYAQKINPAGGKLWAVNGVRVTNLPTEEFGPVVVSDITGNAIIAWNDRRNGNFGIYAQKIDPTGSVLWTSNGAELFTSSCDAFLYDISYDAAGGAIITYTDKIDCFNLGVSAQRVNGSGNVLWQSGGVPVFRSNNVWVEFGDVCINSSGGIIVSANTNRSSNQDIFAQYINADGSLPVSLAYFNYSTDENNITLNWGTTEEINNRGFEIQRKRPDSEEWIQLGFINGSGTTNEPQDYIYTDRLLSTGQYQYRLKQFDYNGSAEYHMMNELAVIGIPSLLDLSQNFPNPFNPETKFQYNLPFDAELSIRLFDVMGRQVAVLESGVKKAGYYSFELNGSNLASGIYFYRLEANGLGKQVSQTKKMLLVK